MFAAMTRRMPWKTVDPLYRGDRPDGVTVPDPGARLNVVEHVLCLGGRGRATQFSSTTELRNVAEYFAGDEGKVYVMRVADATAAGAKHMSRKELLGCLKNFGKGKAKWTDRWEVAQAAQYVARWSEHLIDWSAVASASISSCVDQVFRKR